MMAKKGSQFSLMTSCFKDPSTQHPFYFHAKARTKPHSANQRATVEFRFGRGMPMYINAVFVQRRIP